MRVPYLLIAVFFCVLISYQGIAQENYITVRGQLVDGESQETIPFASIGLQGTTLGTITNADGEFDFHFPATAQASNIIVQMLGYEQLSIPLSAFSTEREVFELQKATLYLDEVVIVDSLDGADILGIALARIEENYPMEAYSMQGFYRDIKKANGEYISLLEAALDIYDKDYSEPRNPSKLRERVGLIEVRKSLYYEVAYTKYFEQLNLLEDLLLDNSIKYRGLPQNQSFLNSISKQEVTQIGNNRVFKLTVTADQGYEMELFIDTEDYGIHELFYKNGDGEKPTQEIGQSGKRTEQIMLEDKNIIFTKYNGRYYLKYLRARTNSRWIDDRTGELQAETELFQELLINEIETNSPKWITTGEKMKRYGLQYQDRPYNKTFWDNYNVIRDTPLDKQIIKDLEKYGDLDSQFENY